MRRVLIFSARSLLVFPTKVVTEVSPKTKQQELAFRNADYFLIARGISVWIGANSSGGTLSKSIGWSAASFGSGSHHGCRRYPQITGYGLGVPLGSRGEQPVAVCLRTTSRI
jgi:hypothetical protein